jgi:CheY-like chemotaxis protein
LTATGGAPTVESMANAQTLLVVDDDPEIAGMLSTRLESRGYKVITASDGKEALTEARRHRPALIVLDVMMPGKNGWEVARALKQDPVTEGIKVIMLTAIGENVNEITLRRRRALRQAVRLHTARSKNSRIARVAIRRRRCGCRSRR